MYAADPEQVNLVFDYMYSSVVVLNEDNICRMAACFLLPQGKRLRSNVLSRIINTMERRLCTRICAMFFCIFN